MKRIWLLFPLVTAISLAPTWARQEKPAGATPPAAAAAPASGVRAEFLEQLAYFEKRLTSLAEAVPAEKYSWRPGDGVRSAGEVYAHLAAANYSFLRILGVATPAGVDPKTISGLGNDKAKTIQALKDSFAFFRKSVEGMDDAGLDNPADFFGQKTTRRGVFFRIAAHLGEHLGQSIAYARLNGVVPPWTAERLKKQAAKQDEKPKP